MLFEGVFQMLLWQDSCVCRCLGLGDCERVVFPERGRIPMQVEEQSWEDRGAEWGQWGQRGGAELARNFPFVLLKPFLTNNIAVQSHFPPTNYLPNNSFSHKLLKSLVNENEVKWWSSFCKCWFNWAAAILEQFVRGWLWNIGSLISQPAFSLCFTLDLKLQMLKKILQFNYYCIQVNFSLFGKFLVALSPTTCKRI